MSDLSKRFEHLLAETAVIPPGSRVLVAVSGGADSVALLLLLYEAAGRFSLHLEAGHLDHALRPESGADADFVQDLCASLGIALHRKRCDIAETAKAQKGNLEEVARLVRRDFLRNVAKSRQCGLIALGHHRDDQVETFLLRLLRGAGPTGLSGMHILSGEFVRPLLGFDRDEIITYLRDKRQLWREDESNADCRLTRNRIRHELLPLLREFNPRIVPRLEELSRLFAQDESYWDEMTAAALAENCRREEAGFYLPRRLLLETHPALAGRLIRAVLREVRGNLRRVANIHVGDVVSLARGRAPQAEIDLPGCWVGRRYDWLVFRPNPPDSADCAPVLITGPGTFPLPDGRCLAVSLQSDHRGGADTSRVEFSAEEISFPLMIRTSRPGDRFCPEGMAGSKKLKDLFIDAKLTKEARMVQALVVRDNEILWVVGMRRCRGYHVRGSAVLSLSVVGD